MSNSFILKNAYLNGQSVDIAVGNGCIDSISLKGQKDFSEEISAGLKEEDGGGLKIFPSFIDAHAHFREPGFEYKEDIESGLTVAKHGGFGSVMVMANTNPVNDAVVVTRYMQERAKLTHSAGPRLYPIGALTVGLEGTELTRMAELKEAGCVAFSNDGKSVSNTEIFRRALEYADSVGTIVIDHCEDSYLSHNAYMLESERSALMGVKGVPGIAETIQVARDILLAEYLNAPVHLAHISQAGSVDMIREAKAKAKSLGKSCLITAETCLHYLFLDESSLENYNTLAKVNPPLGTKADREALRQAVADGTIDILATDHAPHSDEEKETTLDDAPFGISGLDTALALTWALVEEGVITEEKMSKLWCYNPASIFNITVNTFKVGDVADFFLFDANEKWVLTRQAMYSKGKNNPFLGKELKGKVKAHWLNGTKIV